MFGFEMESHCIAMASLATTQVVSPQFCSEVFKKHYKSQACEFEGNMGYKVSLRSAGTV